MARLKEMNDLRPKTCCDLTMATVEWPRKAPTQLIATHLLKKDSRLIEISNSIDQRLKAGSDSVDYRLIYLRKVPTHLIATQSADGSKG